MTEEFFRTQTASSRIKANIVAEYFPKYCRILLTKPQKEIRYLDLFSGPGIYQDHSHSTPMLIARACAEDSALSKKVRLLFNDNRYISELRENILSHFPGGTFEYDPVFGNRTVGEDDKIHQYLNREPGDRNPHPTLLFFDPWGYKGIDTLALAKFLGHWGNELFLFVNIKRIHAAIENNKFDDLMKALFPTTIGKIKVDRRYKANVHERLSLIMDNLANEFQEAIPKGKLYHCAFKFQEEDSAATSHFIIHFTKHSKGYELVKQIFYDFDNIGATLERDGVYAFDAKKMYDAQNPLFDFSEFNISALSRQILSTYKGRKISARKLFEEHQVSTKFCGSHYALTLRKMVEEGLVSARFVNDKPHRVSVLLTPDCWLDFK